MEEAIKASSFIGHCDSTVMLPGNYPLDFESTTVEPLTRPLEDIDLSPFTTSFAPLDGQTISLLDNNLLPSDSTPTCVAHGTTNHLDSSTYQSLFEDYHAAEASIGQCIQSSLPARPGTHQPSSSDEQNTTSQSHPAKTSYQLTSPARPKRRGRPRIYPRPDDPQHLPPPPPHSRSSNPIHTREQNRLAARRFRARHDTYTAALNAQAAELTGENRVLKSAVARLREEALGLRYEVLKHAECGCGLVERYLESNLGRMIGAAEGGVGGDGDEEDVDAVGGGAGDVRGV